MKYQRAARFKKDFKALPDGIQDAARKAFLLFRQNPRHPSLRIKKMEGFESIWEGRITLGYVFTFQWDVDPDTREPIAVFRRIGKHDEVYSTP